jgi:hypothetical protein
VANPLEQAGAAPKGPSNFAPIPTDRFFTGIWTNRSPLRDAAVPYLYGKFYGASRYESLWDGQNTEISPSLTLIRAPGHSVFNYNDWEPILDFHSFKIPGANRPDRIIVLADTATGVYDASPPGNQILIRAKSAGAGQTFFQSIGSFLYCGDGVDNWQYVQSSYEWQAGYSFPAGAFIVDPNNNIQLALGEYLACSNISVVNGLLTATVSSALSLSTTQAVSFTNLQYATFLNDLTVTVTSIADTTFTANVNAPNYSSAGPENGYCLTNANGNLGSTEPAGWGMGQFDVTIDGTNLWSMRGPCVRPWGIQKPPSAPQVANTLNATSSVSTWAANTYYMPVPLVIDISGFVYQLTTAGTTDTSVPVFDETYGAITSDGSAKWTSLGTGTRGLLTPYALGAVVAVTWGVSSTIYEPNPSYNQFSDEFDDFNNQSISSTIPVVVTTYYSAFFQCTQAGTTSDSNDSNISWPSGVGSSILDGSVQWTNVGYQVQRGSSASPPVAGSSSPQVVSEGNMIPGVVGNSQLVSTGGMVIDGYGAVENVIYSGVSGTSTPAWGQTSGSYTTDNGITWVNQGGDPSVGGTSGNTASWMYCYAYQDSLTGFTGTASQLSSPIILAPYSYMEVVGEGTDDAHIDTILVFRTAQGGATPLWIGQIDNPGKTQWTYADYSPDNGFTNSTQNIALEADLTGENSPPPKGFKPCGYHLSSVFGYVTNLLYYSDAIYADDFGGPEAFPPNNYIEFPVTGITTWSTSAGLYAVLEDQVQLVAGTAPPFNVSNVVNIGILSKNCLTVNGGTPFAFTYDRQMVLVDPSSGWATVGFPIGNRLAADFDPTSSYVTWHVMGTDQRVFISNGQGYYNMMNTPSPETGSVWSPFRAIPCSCVKSIETTVGVKQLLLGPPEASSPSTSPPLSPPYIPTGPILTRDLTTNLDNGVPYQANAVVGSVVLCHSSQMAELAYVTLDAKRIGSPPKIGVLLGEVYGWPNCPPWQDISKFVHDVPRLPESQTLWSNRYHFNQDGKPCWCRHFQLNIQFAAEDAASEVMYLTTFAAIHKERIAQQGR